MAMRRNVQVRITTRDDPAGANGLWGPTTPEQRLELLAEASRTGWALTGRPVPSYSRADIPVRVFRRSAVAIPDRG
jgi:hypothetical protein